eukprot:scaffold131153_cov13-Tisochrysis_lutea.AAC.1
MFDKDILICGDMALLREHRPFPGCIGMSNEHILIGRYTRTRAHRKPIPRDAMAILNKHVVIGDEMWIACNEDAPFQRETLMILVKQRYGPVIVMV